jgi:hypothetical protein
MKAFAPGGPEFRDMGMRRTSEQVRFFRLYFILDFCVNYENTNSPEIL